MTKFMSNGSKIDYVQQCVHLGAKTISDISIKIYPYYITHTVDVYGSQLWRLNSKFLFGMEKNN